MQLEMTVRWQNVCFIVEVLEVGVLGAAGCYSEGGVLDCLEFVDACV